MPSEARRKIRHTSMLDITQPSPGLYSLQSRPSPLWSCFVPSTKVRTTSGGATVTFSASKVETLQQYMASNDSMSYQEAYHLITGLYDQLLSLHTRHSLTVPFFSPLGIVLVDGRGYVADPALLTPLEDGEAHIPEIPSDLPFVPPELRTGAKKDRTVDARVALYTLAGLCGASLFPEWNSLASYQDFVHTLEPIKHTSLYWCLLRCLETSADDRVFLFL